MPTRRKPEPEPDLSSVYPEEPNTDETVPQDSTDVFAEPVDAPEERVPQVVHSRESAAEFITFAYSMAGMALQRTDPPVGRVLALQAPLAGKRLDEYIAGTIVDRIIQPFAKAGNHAEDIGSLVAFPILVAMYERSETLGVAIEPILRQVIQNNLVDLAPVLKAENAKAKQAAKTLDELQGLPGFDVKDENGKIVDPITAVLGYLFAPPPGFVPEEPSDE